ncbi:DUF7108 family protein [Halolamina salifodinae]|uniref:RnhA operon protein n=1 Tax=Halolamina salifodinae TaxID=1202767 RepID=A0A8T4GWY7_9EURY|nr:hypothetical protein [Halolamina salifodinae]MBP1985808.1 hypothetical protein [Halolamina salifodinae]
MTPDSDTAPTDEEERVPDIPAEAVDEAERLTRLARAAERRADEDNDAEAEAELYRERRADLAAKHDYEDRIRDEDDTLVLYPEEWLADGTVQFDRIEETERAVEVSLSGPGDPEQWQEVADHNDALVDAVAESAPTHEENARAFAAFASNHYAKPAEDLTSEEVREFFEEYYPRNVWPDEADASLVEESVRKLFDAADSEPPAVIDS